MYTYMYIGRLSYLYGLSSAVSVSVSVSMSVLVCVST